MLIGDLTDEQTSTNPNYYSYLFLGFRTSSITGHKKKWEYGKPGNTHDDTHQSSMGNRKSTIECQCGKNLPETHLSLTCSSYERPEPADALGAPFQGENDSSWKPVASDIFTWPRSVEISSQPPALLSSSWVTRCTSVGTEASIHGGCSFKTVQISRQTPIRRNSTCMKYLPASLLNWCDQPEADVQSSQAVKWRWNSLATMMPPWLYTTCRKDFETNSDHHSHVGSCWAITHIMCHNKIWHQRTASATVCLAETWAKQI